MIGLTLGKFLPFHKGHEFLIKAAMANCDYLIVLVGVDENDPYSFDVRKRWIRQCVSNFDYHKRGDVVIVEQEEFDKSVQKDENGTITDESYWTKWLDDTNRILNDFSVYPSHVFTSDLYGERIAKELNCVWVPVDPDRETVPISATDIRNNFEMNFNMLPSYVRHDLSKVVAVVGPESTGKSTLVKRLGNDLTAWPVPEYGRFLAVNRKNELDYTDFRIIQRTQKMMIDSARSNELCPIVVTDTEALVTALYADIWHPNEDNSALYEFAKNQQIDKYILLAPTVPWVQDGFRISDDETKRWNFYHSVMSQLEAWQKPFEVISSSDFDEREEQARKIIKDMIPKPKY
jgi:HTH-type transcriptional repressor of NAD biosynthesis genes